MSGKWALLLLALACSTDAAAQAWETTDWTVECLTVSEGTCEATEGAGANAYFEDALQDASRWLRGLGFSGPVIEYRAGTDVYVAYISDWYNEDEKGKRTSIGVYYPDDAQLYLTSDRYFAIGEGDTQQKRENALANDIENTAAVVHELFHAVQHAYYRGGSAETGWIDEGMADAVALAWARRTMPDTNMQGGGRAFDYPLHKPKDESDAYLTSRFWRGIGRILGSDDGIRYLDAILQQDLASNSGLGGVDKGLREFDPEGLYNLYPEFIASSTNNAHFFDEVDRMDLVYDDSAKVEESVRGRVREVAADAIEVSVHVPAGETAKLEIEFANDHEDLHLVVDGKRLDKTAGSSRNVFRANIEGRDGVQTFLVRVANVARNAVDTSARNYLLDFALMPTTGESQCTFTATMKVEPIGSYKYFFADGKKLPIRRTVSVTGVATIDDRRHHLTLSFEDERSGAGSGMFTIDISPLAIGGSAGHVATRGGFGYDSPEKGPHDVQLDIEENADPGDLDGWEEMTLREQIDSGVGYPNRLAMRRLRGEFRSTRAEKPDCCVSYVQAISGTFDAGNGPYHCEGGVEMMEKAYETMMDMFNDTPERKADPGKLDGLLD